MSLGPRAKSDMCRVQTNCLAEIQFQEALERAEELDDFQRTTGRLFGPLHGLPVSLKDQFHVRGLDTTCGFVSWIGSTKSEIDEGVLVRSLRQAGAVIFVKTNVPTSLVIGETTNNIIGSTINPFNRNLSAGGASGGEGALLALKGAPLGWASDIAGSIRIPCCFNNLYGIRPSSGRLSATGLSTSLPGLPTAAHVVGPMCSDLPSLIDATKWFISSNAWQEDHEVVDLPWREEIFRSTQNRISRPGRGDGTLVFAVLRCDDRVLPHPPVLRAMTIVENALKSSGYEVGDAWSEKYTMI
jgi:amidase